MVITYFGEGGFRLQSGEVSVLIDPQGNRLKADLTIFTKADLDANVVSEEGVINFPGEYEGHGVEIDGAPIKEESKGKTVQSAYLIRMEDIKVAVLGGIEKTPSAEVLDSLDEPDILILPAQKGKYLSAEDAAKLAKQLEPAVVIPSFYGSEAELQKSFESKSVAEEKFVCKKKDLERGKVELKILSPK